MVVCLVWGAIAFVVPLKGHFIKELSSLWFWRLKVNRFPNKVFLIIAYNVVNHKIIIFVNIVTILKHCKRLNLNKLNYSVTQFVKYSFKFESVRVFKNIYTQLCAFKIFYF